MQINPADIRRRSERRQRPLSGRREGRRERWGGDVQPHNPFALPSALLHYPPVFLNGEAGTALPPTPHCYLLPTFCYLFPRNRPLAEPNEETNIIRSVGTPSAPILLSFRPAAALGRKVHCSESILYKVRQPDPQGQSHPNYFRAN